MLGAWSDATDGYEGNLDVLTAPTDGGYAGIYHRNNPPQWDGPTGDYGRDLRAPLWPTESKTWAPLRTWAELSYASETMSLAFQPHPSYLPPTDRKYTLELLSVPLGVNGAPPVGTTWDLAPDAGALFTVELPTYRAETGEDAYQLAFTIGPANLPGDMDGNGLVDVDDVGPFVLGLNDPAAFARAFGLPPADRGDVDTDGDFDFDDIDRFTTMVEGASAQAVAEPSNVALLIVASLVLSLAWRNVRRRHPRG